MTGWRRLIATLLTAAMFNACTTVQKVPVANVNQISQSVRVGDSVKCTLRDGTQTSFKVVAVEPDALVGPQIRIPMHDIVSLEVDKFSLGKTSLATTVLVVAAVAVTLVILLKNAGADDVDENDFVRPR